MIRRRQGQAEREPHRPYVLPHVRITLPAVSLAAAAAAAARLDHLRRRLERVDAVGELVIEAGVLACFGGGLAEEHGGQVGRAFAGGRRFLGEYEVGWEVVHVSRGCFGGWGFVEGGLVEVAFWAEVGVGEGLRRRRFGEGSCRPRVRESSVRRGTRFLENSANRP